MVDEESGGLDDNSRLGYLSEGDRQIDSKFGDNKSISITLSIQHCDSTVVTIKLQS